MPMDLALPRFRPASAGARKAKILHLVLAAAERGIYMPSRAGASLKQRTVMLARTNICASRKFLPSCHHSAPMRLSVVIIK
jgi:hypothetical protein